MSGGGPIYLVNIFSLTAKFHLEYVVFLRFFPSSKQKIPHSLFAGGGVINPFFLGSWFLTRCQKIRSF